MTKTKTLKPRPNPLEPQPTVELPPEPTATKKEASIGSGLFAQVRRGKQRRPRRVILYGLEGLGKSTWASKAPKPIFVPTEDGLDDIDCESFPLVKTFDEFMNILRAVYKEPHDYQTLVVDTLDWLEQMVWTDLCKEHGKATLGDFGYGDGYNKSLEKFKEVVKAFNSIRDKRDMTIVCLAHSVIERFEAPDLDSYDRYVPRLHKKVAGYVMQWADEVLFATYETFTQTKQEKFNRERAVAVGTGKRIVRTTEQPHAMAKNRLGLPEEIPLDWNAYASYFNGADAATTTKSEETEA